jgi:hypothetical protein
MNNKQSKLAAITMMAAAMGGMPNDTIAPKQKKRLVGIYPPNPSGLISGGKYMPGHIHKGCKKFIFDENGNLMSEIKIGITAFSCIAYNEKSAIKKFQKWQKNKVIQ